MSKLKKVAAPQITIIHDLHLGSESDSCPALRSIIHNIAVQRFLPAMADQERLAKFEPFCHGIDPWSDPKSVVAYFLSQPATEELLVACAAAADAGDMVAARQIKARLHTMYRHGSSRLVLRHGSILCPSDTASSISL